MTRIIAGPGATGEAAIDLLSRFAFVGRSDRFNESLVMMQRKLRIPDIRYRSKWVAPSNDIKKRLLADPAAMEQLAGVNQEDEKVWRHVVEEVYPKQQAEFGQDLDDSLADFERRNARMTRFRYHANLNYMAYVLKWRLRYRPWIRKVTGDPTAG